MEICNLGFRHCRHEVTRTEKKINVDARGKEIIFRSKRSVFDRIFCVDPNCGIWLRDTNLRWEDIDSSAA